MMTTFENYAEEHCYHAIEPYHLLPLEYAPERNAHECGYRTIKLCNMEAQMDLMKRTIEKLRAKLAERDGSSNGENSRSPTFKHH